MTSAISDVLRAASRLHMDGHGDIVNVWYFQKTDIGPTSDSDTMSDLSIYLDEMFDEIDNLISIDCDFIDINCFNVTQDKPLGNVAWDSLTSGTRTGHPLPAQMAAFLQGNSGYSRNWARKFIGVFSENENDANGFIETILLTGLTNLAVRWLAGPVAATVGDWIPVVYYTKLAQWVNVNEVIIRNIWATIRRRRAGVGV